mgnify:CR=1 FL=1
MMKWYEVWPNIDSCSMASRLKEATDMKDILRLLLGFHKTLCIYLKSIQL